MKILDRVAIVLLVAALTGCGGDGGWLDPGAPAGSSTPHLAVADDGRVVLSYLAADGAGSRLDYVTLEGSGWSQPTTVAAGEGWFVNWADFPSVVPISGDVWAAHWLVRSATATYAYDAVVAVSRDGGRTWSAGIAVHDDGTPTEHGFLSLYPAADGVGALWLDGRNMATSPDGATQLLAGGLRSEDLAVMPPAPVDERVCDCCQTDLAVTAEGPVVVYRDRSAEEIRDIAVSRLREGTWEPARLVAADGWQISGCPVNGPAVAALGRQVAVAWYTGHPQPRVAVAFSDDAAATFSAPIEIASGQVIGRVDVVLVEAGDAVVSWLDAVPGTLRYRRVAPDGSLGAVHETAPMSPERNAGFPQMVRDGDGLVFAWTDVGSNRIRTRRLPVPG